MIKRQKSSFYTRALTQDGLKRWQGKKERQGQEVMSLVCFPSCGYSFSDTPEIVLLLLQNNMYPTILALSTWTLSITWPQWRTMHQWVWDELIPQVLGSSHVIVHMGVSHANG